MPEALSRWCLYCDAVVRSGARGGPQVRLEDYADDLVFRSRQGLAHRIYEHENRIMRISDAIRIELPNGNPGLAMVLTLGDRRGANPSFIHFRRGQARDAERREGEVKGRSAHCIIDLVENPDNAGHHTIILEDATGIGRTPVTRLLQSQLAALADERDERFASPDTGSMIKLKPVIQVWPQQSRQMREALERGRLSMVELYDTRPVPTFDESPEFTVKRRILRVEVEPAEDGVRATLERLGVLGRREGYGHMKVSWRLPDGQVARSDVRTDLEDIGTALMARRELISVQNPMSDAADRLNDEFVGEMLRLFG